MSNLEIDDPNKLREAYAATLDASNQWLEQTYPESSLRLELVAKATARQVAQAFGAPEIERVVDWDWEQLFFRKVQHKRNMWMFAITIRGKYGAACLGTINISNDCISIDYLERHPNANELRHLTTLIAVQYVEALAAYLELPTVRINDPDPQLVAYYEGTFGFARHEEAGAVRYLSKIVQS